MLVTFLSLKSTRAGLERRNKIHPWNRRILVVLLFKIYVDVRLPKVFTFLKVLEFLLEDYSETP
jgi:hypothetical protein